MSKAVKNIVVGIAVAALLALLAWAFTEGRKELAAERERERPVVAPSQAAHGVLTLDTQTQARIDLKTETLTGTEFHEQANAYGTVIDPAPLANLDRLMASWGDAAPATEDRTEFVQRLAAFKSVLVRVDLPAGESLPGRPTKSWIVPVAAENESVDAVFLGPALSVDSQTLGEGFVLLVKDNRFGLRPGAAVTAYFVLPGESRKGVNIPRAALVRAAGGAWAYVQTADDQFTRRPVMLDHPMSNGWFAATGFVPGDRIVVQGGQLLLSEEMKSQIQVGEEGQGN